MPRPIRRQHKNAMCSIYSLEGSGANLKGSASGSNGLNDRTSLRTGTLQGSAFRPNCRHLNRPQTEDARRSILPAYHGVTAKVQHFRQKSGLTDSWAPILPARSLVEGKASSKE